MSAQYIVIGTATCPFCLKAKALLDSKEIEYVYRDIGQVNKEDMTALMEIAKVEFQTVPQIFKYKEGGGLDYIGGFTDLEKTYE